MRPPRSAGPAAPDARRRGPSRDARPRAGAGGGPAATRAPARRSRAAECPVGQSTRQPSLVPSALGARPKSAGAPRRRSGLSRPAARGPAGRRPGAAGRGHGRQTFIHGHDLDGRQRTPACSPPRRAPPGGRAQLARQRDRQPDHHADRLVVGDQFEPGPGDRQPGHRSAMQRGHPGSHPSARIGDGHTDPSRPEIDPEHPSGRESRGRAGPGPDRGPRPAGRRPCRPAMARSGSLPPPPPPTVRAAAEISSGAVTRSPLAGQRHQGGTRPVRDCRRGPRCAGRRSGAPDWPAPAAGRGRVRPTLATSQPSTALDARACGPGPARAACSAARSRPSSSREVVELALEGGGQFVGAGARAGRPRRRSVARPGAAGPEWRCPWWPRYAAGWSRSSPRRRSRPARSGPAGRRGCRRTAPCDSEPGPHDPNLVAVLVLEEGDGPGLVGVGPWSSR